tara:strand:- start:1309 stop:1863 length:555 start_codon:yes stop_codon:yes gene_type:complete
MKNIFLLGLAIVLITSCESNVKQRYTQQSPEIETYKQMISDYENQNWEAMASHYADTAKIMNNVTEKNAKTIAEEVKTGKEDASFFSSWSYVDGESEYEMVTTDKGETWVNFWGLWEGTLKSNNKVYSIPVHITARFVDGKIVRELGYWDISKIVADSMQLKEKADQEIMKDSTMDAKTSMKEE